MKLRRAPLLTIAAAALTAIALAACGGSSDNSSDNTSAATTGGGQTVSTKSVSGVGTVLVDSSGQALYTNDQDSGMKVACSGSCTAIWVPLMAPSSGQPTASDQAVQAKLGEINANGGSQVTFGGKPLYSFTEDSPGEVTGNGFSDQFDGTSFTWTVASTGNVSSGSSGTTTSSGGGSSGGGYGY